MKYQALLNGERVASSQELDRTIRAARKAALSFPNPENRLLHISIWEDIDDSEQKKIVHHDLILPEDLDTLKDLDPKDLHEIGRTDLTKQTKAVFLKTTVEKQPLYNVGDRIKVNDDLYVITAVNESRATAMPVRKKKIKIKDKLTDKESTFSAKGRAVSLAPYASNVLSEEEVKAELAKLDAQPTQKIEQEVEGNHSEGGRRSTDDERRNRRSSTTSDDSGHNSGNVDLASGDSPPKRKRGRPKGWRKLTSQSLTTTQDTQGQENSG